MGLPVRIYTVWFCYGQHYMYDQLSAVFLESLRRNWPDAVVDFDRIAAPEKSLSFKDRQTTVASTARSFVSNATKLRYWVNYALAHKEEHVILMDCDMLVLRAFPEVFNVDFDIGITLRKPESKMPINGGVVFVKPTKTAHAFLSEWLRIDDSMTKNKHLHNQYRRVYAGQNQASMGYMLENYKGTNVVGFPCSIYNSVEDNWHLTPEQLEQINVLHIKSGTRDCVFDLNTKRSKPLRKQALIIETWFKYKQFAMKSGLLKEVKKPSKRIIDESIFESKWDEPSVRMPIKMGVENGTEKKA